MRTIFFGSPDFAVPCLEALHDMSDVAVVVSQPDRPAGRGLAVRPPAVKKRALELGLEVWQPTKVRTPEFAEELRAVEADVAVVDLDEAEERTLNVALNSPAIEGVFTTDSRGV